MRIRLLLPIVSAALATLIAGADWPQWRGPDRSNVSHERGLLASWPEGAPKHLWTFEEAGIGFSGPSIVGDRLYVMGADDTNEFVLAIDVRTGKKIWSSVVGNFYKNAYGSGPRGTPTIDGDALVVEGATGEVVCLDPSSGAKKWSVPMVGSKGLGGAVPVWGYSESPLVDGNQVVCTPGGSKGALAALDRKTGAVVWQSKDLTDAAGYASPVLAELGGIRQYVQQTMKGVVGVAAADGKVLWSYPRQEYRTAVIPTAVVNDGMVYGVAGYGAGACSLKLTHLDGKFEVENLYDDSARKLMDNKHGGVVAVGNRVFGWSDSSRGKWVCQDLKTGKEVWSSTKLGRGSITCADGNLYCYSEKDGTCVLVPAGDDGWREKGRFTIPKHADKRDFRVKDAVWTHPVVANGKLYLRDQQYLFCYDIKDAAP
jgi:outer membrane protein assembly factor BamB